LIASSNLENNPEIKICRKTVLPSSRSRSRSNKRLSKRIKIIRKEQQVMLMERSRAISITKK